MSRTKLAGAVTNGEGTGTKEEEPTYTEEEWGAWEEECALAGGEDPCTQLWSVVKGTRGGPKGGKSKGKGKQIKSQQQPSLRCS